MPLTAEQLNEIRARMEEEHRLDHEALERLMRFLPQVQNGHAETKPTHIPVDNTMAPETSMLGSIERILSEGSNRTWTVQQIKQALTARGYKLQAKSPEASIGVAMKKLFDRDRVTIVRRGSGREPNIYQWSKPDTRSPEFSSPET